jgi:hypothetical protein
MGTMGACGAGVGAGKLGTFGISMGRGSGGVSGGSKAETAPLAQIPNAPAKPPMASRALPARLKSLGELVNVLAPRIIVIPPWPRRDCIAATRFRRPRRCNQVMAVSLTSAEPLPSVKIFPTLLEKTEKAKRRSRRERREAAEDENPCAHQASCGENEAICEFTRTKTSRSGIARGTCFPRLTHDLPGV